VSAASQREPIIVCWGKKSTLASYAKVINYLYGTKLPEERTSFAIAFVEAFCKATKGCGESAVGTVNRRFTAG